MTIDPTTATLDECRDWLARRAGWAKITGGDSGRWFWHIPGVPTARDYYESPIPETLDAAAEAMPSGWWWKVWVDSLPGVQVKAIPPNIDQPHIYIDQSDTEILARFRLVVACCMVDDAARKERGE